MASGHPQRIGHLLLREFELRGQLLGRRRTLVLLFEAGEGLVDLVERADLVQRQTHDTRLLGQSLENRLTNPPHRIGDELEATGFIELLGGLDQTEVTLVDQVRKAQTLVLVLFGDRDHEAKIRLGQFFEGLLIAFLDSLGEFHLLFHRDELLLADFLEIFVQRGALAVGDGLCNLELTHIFILTS